MPDETLAPRTSWPATFGWAAYLACSWTWCIGMFLPVLLVRDFGVWGFVVFAVPNVLGAAAMGWIIASPERSERLVARHALAVRAFSMVTIAFQFYFMMWLLYWVRGSMACTAAAAASLAPGLAMYAFQRETTRLALAASLWGASAATFAVLVLAWPIPSLPRPLMSATDLLWLAPVVAFGFLLCPYLDATFHRVRQSQPGRRGRVAFAAGFGLLFPFVIGFTLWYSGLVAFEGRNVILSSNAWLAIVPYMMLQLFFTASAHGSELRLERPTRAPRGSGVYPPKPATRRRWLLAALVAIGLLAFFIDGAPMHAGLTPGEVVYRLFMAFYGLVFPGYVWLLMIPTRDGHAGAAGANGRRKLLIWCFAVGVAAPMFWMGFIERQTPWLAPGLAVVLLARLFLPRSTVAGPPLRP